MVLTRKAIPGILLTASLLASSNLLARGWGGGPNWVGGPGIDIKTTTDSELKADVVRDKDKQLGSPTVNMAPTPAATPITIPKPEATPINLPKPPPPEGLPIPIPVPTP